MKKREIIYLHGLLGEVRRAVERRQAVPANCFEAYEQYGVGPTSIHRTKGEHEEAVRRLLDALVSAIGASPAAEGAEEASIESR